MKRKCAIAHQNGEGPAAVCLLHSSRLDCSSGRSSKKLFFFGGSSGRHEGFPTVFGGGNAFAGTIVANKHRAAKGSARGGEARRPTHVHFSRTTASWTSLDDHDGGCGAVVPQTRRWGRRPCWSKDRVQRVWSLHHQRDSTDVVSGTRWCQQLHKETGAAFSSHAYMAECPNLERVCAHVVFFFPLSRSGSCQITCIWLSHRSRGFWPRAPQNLQGFKPPQKTCSVGFPKSEGHERGEMQPRVSTPWSPSLLRQHLKRPRFRSANLYKELAHRSKLSTWLQRQELKLTTRRTERNPTMCEVTWNTWWTCECERSWCQCMSLHAL